MKINASKDYIEIGLDSSSSFIFYVYSKNILNSRNVILLSSIRFLPYIEKSKIFAVLKKQTENLESKLNLIKLLFPTYEKLIDNYQASRILIIPKSNHSQELDGWKLITEVLRMLSKSYDLKFFTQPDYDQMINKSFLGKDIGNIEIKLAHYPTAFGTYQCFNKLIHNIYQTGQLHKYGIIGYGNVGKKIYHYLLGNSHTEVFVYDQVASKIDLLPNCCYDINTLMSKNIDSLILCANSGSLNSELASLINNSRIIIIGGPEAGLDSSMEYIENLTKLRRHFIPSQICGILGILFALLENLKAIDSSVINDIETKYIAHIEFICNSVMSNNSLFHLELKNYINSIFIQ